MAALALIVGSGLAFAADSPPAEWSYKGATGPAHWGAEDSNYATCSSGKAQSPIDIEKTTKKDLPALEFDYHASPLTVTDTGHSFQVNYQPGSELKVDGEDYHLVQFHFHRPSEEYIQGRKYSMVVHLVHKNDKGDLAVVAVLLGKGKTNAFLKPIFDNFPPVGSKESVVKDQSIDVEDLLPATHGYYTFDGSLTTPPCSENVRWFVLKTPVQVSGAQIAQFSRRYAHNARPVQALHGRVILESNN
jgi:carbonic anhydrase